MGPVVPRVRHGGHAVHPDRVHLVHRRGARLQGAPPQVRGGHRQGHRRHPQVLRHRGRVHLLLSGMGAGVLPRGRVPIRHASGHNHGGEDARRPQLGQEPAAGGPLLRMHPQQGPRVHEGPGVRVLQARHPDQDEAQRGRPQPVRDRTRLRAGQPGHRPQPGAHGRHEDRRREPRFQGALPREALRGNQRIGEALQLVHRNGGHRPAVPREDRDGEPQVPYIHREHPEGRLRQQRTAQGVRHDGVQLPRASPRFPSS